MSRVSEGVRRLSLVLGILGCAGMLLLLGMASWAEYASAAAALERISPRVEQTGGTSSDLVERAIERARKDAEERKQNKLVGVVVFVPLSGLIGFLVPWGTVRVIGWVVQGFAKDWRN